MQLCIYIELGIHWKGIHFYLVLFVVAVAVSYSISCMHFGFFFRLRLCFDVFFSSSFLHSLSSLQFCSYIFFSIQFFFFHQKATRWAKISLSFLDFSITNSFISFEICSVKWICSYDISSFFSSLFHFFVSLFVSGRWLPGSCVFDCSLVSSLDCIHFTI